LVEIIQGVNKSCSDNSWFANLTDCSKKINVTEGLNVMLMLYLM